MPRSVLHIVYQVNVSAVRDQRRMFCRLLKYFEASEENSVVLDGSTTRLINIMDQDQSESKGAV